MSEKVVIIGGGLAGLCAAIELCRIGIYPILIEAGSYPAHKVCGEFLSPESLPWLQKLNIHPTTINEIFLGIDSKNVIFKLPKPAGSLSHFILDAALADKASKMGTQVRSHVKVTNLRPKQQASEFHVIELSTGETLHAHSILVATGRLPSLYIPPKSFKYMGIKAHFEGIELNQALKMFSFKEAYMGLSPIENEKTNLACLASMRAVERAGSPDLLMKQLVDSNSHLKELISRGKNVFGEWMTAKIPFFGFKSTPDWLDAYFIGDAAISLPPACGGGLSLAINSGIKSAGFVAKQNFHGFKKQSRRDNAGLMRNAKGLHHLFMVPWLGKAGFQICSLWPSLPQEIFLLSRTLR
ncbi:MAG: FAD-dependent monooxygenase [Parachlamydiaceae bacterium]|nr:FAD-dependent monooxygenase [Parachlamydiaceae bacterium]